MGNPHLGLRGFRLEVNPDRDAGSPQVVRADALRSKFIWERREAHRSLAVRPERQRRVPGPWPQSQLGLRRARPV